LLYQRSYVESLLDRVRMLLASDYQAAGKGELYELLEPYLTHQGEAPSRAEISRRLNLSAAAVTMSLHRLRSRYAALLRQEVAATVDDPSEVDDELQTLLSIVSGAS
jgi:RNA polymerase sigma-70 factor (ECF subfamily)